MHVTVLSKVARLGVASLPEQPHSSGGGRRQAVELKQVGYLRFTDTVCQDIISLGRNALRDYEAPALDEALQAIMAKRKEGPPDSVA